MSITLKAARVNAGLTQAEFAEALGVSETTIRNYEKGHSFPDVLTLKKIEEVTGVGYQDISFLPNVPVKPDRHKV